MHVVIPGIGTTFWWNLGNFTDSSKNGVLRCALDSSLVGSFWSLESPIWRVGQGRSRNVSLAALNLKGISGGGPVGPRIRSDDSGILRFHVNSLFLTF